MIFRDLSGRARGTTVAPTSRGTRDGGPLGTEPPVGAPLRSDRLRIQGPVARYAFSIVGVLVALELRLLLIPLTGKGAPFVIFFAAALVTSLFAGVGPALLSLAISLPTAVYLFVLPAGYTRSEAMYQSALYAIDGLIIVYLTILIARWRRRLEAANARLRESEERFRLTIEEAPIGMALVALDGHFVRVNRVLCEITGYSPEELSQRTFQDITHHDDVEKDLELSRELAAGQIPRYHLEKRYIRKDRSIVDVMLSASILRGPDGDARYYIAQVEDITARKRAEAALKRAVTARDEVLGVVAHDLRNPLNTILMQASILEEIGAVPTGGDQAPQHVIVRSAKRMNRLIRDLLDVAGIESGQLKVDHVRLSARALVRETVDLHTPLATSCKLELSSEVASDVHDIWGDHDRLLQVFDNLVGNAIKFTPGGGRIVVGATMDGDSVRFSVTDSGTGIAPDNLAHIFERFWQAATRERRLGAGLGLPITRGIVTAHGGKIWATSIEGQGSTFFFTIPAVPPPRNRPLEPKDVGRATSRRAKHRGGR